MVVARFLYALFANDGFLTADYISGINAVFVTARKWGLTSSVPIASDFIEIAHNKLFKAALAVKHCLHSLLPPVRDRFDRSLTKRVRNLLLPLVRIDLPKENFIVRCLFQYS